MHGKRRPPCGNGGPRGVAAGCGSDPGSQDRQMMMMNNIQASASAILQTANLLPSDSIRIKKSSFAGSEKIAEKVNATMGNIKILDGKLFNTSGRLKGGNEAVHNVFETQFGRITILKNKLNDLIAELKEKKEKCTRLFKATFNRPYSRKCKQKQNRKKATKAKNNPLRS